MPRTLLMPRNTAFEAVPQALGSRTAANGREPCRLRCRPQKAPNQRKTVTEAGEEDFSCVWTWRDVGTRDYMVLFSCLDANALSLSPSSYNDIFITYIICNMHRRNDVCTTIYCLKTQQKQETTHIRAYQMISYTRRHIHLVLAKSREL